MNHFNDQKYRNFLQFVFYHNSSPAIVSFAAQKCAGKQLAVIHGGKLIANLVPIEMPHMFHFQVNIILLCMSNTDSDISLACLTGKRHTA